MTFASTSKYRSRAIANNVIAFSISYQRENMLARGMGLEHLRELLIRLARPILRQGASLAYGGNWNDTEDNFIFTLLRLVSAEQEEQSLGASNSDLKIGKLYNHLPWPWYLAVTPKTEAQWINSCRIVRITQELAGFSEAEVVPDASSDHDDPRVIFNKAVTLSAMRRLMMSPMSLDIPDVPQPETIPPVVARILLGGKVDGYAGFLPGIFEEALVTLNLQRPIYVLGGFGGAAEILANAILAEGEGRPKELTLDWHKQQNPALVKLLDSANQFRAPPPLTLASLQNSLDALFNFVLNARADLSGTLRTGLSEQEDRELLRTSNVSNAVHLVRSGLVSTKKLPTLPA
jgi:SLOG cluster2